mmetsp:Transcript_25193/g.45403  ORF Transcript_25193/g.45403 Transcript_25193/m.45403 type:complete len:346 (-) Transcript_25193:164-1201(-)
MICHPLLEVWQGSEFFSIGAKFPQCPSDVFSETPLKILTNAELWIASVPQYVDVICKLGESITSILPQFFIGNVKINFGLISFSFNICGLGCCRVRIGRKQIHAHICCHHENIFENHFGINSILGKQLGDIIAHRVGHKRRGNGQFEHIHAGTKGLPRSDRIPVSVNVIECPRTPPVSSPTDGDPEVPGVFFMHLHEAVSLHEGTFWIDSPSMKVVHHVVDGVIRADLLLHRGLEIFKRHHLAVNAVSAETSGVGAVPDILQELRLRLGVRVVEAEVVLVAIFSEFDVGHHEGDVLPADAAAISGAATERFIFCTDFHSSSTAPLCLGISGISGNQRHRHSGREE